MYDVIIKRRVLKNIRRMPKTAQKMLANLVEDLRDRGPVQKDWPNFSKLGKQDYHCHLSHSWVACWCHEPNAVIIEVYYAGSRENAPY